MHSSSQSTRIGYITGPRAEQPPGVRVIEPRPGTRQHQRGNLYIIVELSGASPLRDGLSNRMLDVLQRAYYSAKGSQAEVMALGIDAAHKLLQEHNRDHGDTPLGVGLLCAALLNERLLVATSGSTFALVRAGEKVHMFPSEVEENGAVNPAPERIEVFRQKVAPADAIFLGGGSWLAKVPLRTLASIVAFTSAETCDAAADELYDRSGSLESPGLIVVLGGDAPPSQGGGPQDSRGPSAGSGSGKPGAPWARPKRPRLGGLPTALSAPPPVQPAAMRTQPTMEVAGTSSGPEPPPGPELWQGAEAAAPDISDAAVAVDASEGRAPMADETGVTPIEEAVPVDPGESPRWQASIASWSRQFFVGVAGGLAATHQFFRRMLPDTASIADPDPEDAGTDEANTEDEAQAAHLFAAERPATAEAVDEREVAWPYAPAPVETEQAEIETQTAPEVEDAGAARVLIADEAGEVGMAPVAAPAGAVAAAADTAAPIGAEEKPPPLPALEPFSTPEPARGARARLFILLAVMIVVLAPAVAGGIYLSEAPNRRAEAEERTNGAAALLASAQDALDLEDRVVARRQLTEAQDFLMQAVELDDWTDRRRSLAQDIQTEMQEVLQIAPLYGLTEPILTFDDGAAPTRIVVNNDEIYILDSGREAVYRYRFDPARGVATAPEGQVVLSQGDTIDNVVVGTLHDMAWLPPNPGREDKPSLLILDRQNNVFRFDQRVEGVTRLAFGGQAEWGSAAQIKTFSGRVYIADEAAGQVYRYEAGLYETPGEPWFAAETQTSLAGIRDMAIDGDIWFLYNNGMILRYRDRQQVPFALESGFGFAEEPSGLYVVREGRGLIYLVDARQDRIMVYNKQGEYQFQLVAPEGDALRGVSALTVDEIAGRMFILTHQGLYLHPLVE